MVVFCSVDASVSALCSGLLFFFSVAVFGLFRSVFRSRFGLCLFSCGSDVRVVFSGSVEAGAAGFLVKECGGMLRRGCLNLGRQFGRQARRFVCVVLVFVWHLLGGIFVCIFLLCWGLYLPVGKRADPGSRYELCSALHASLSPSLCLVVSSFFLSGLYLLISSSAVFFIRGRGLFLFSLAPPHGDTL